MTAIEIIVIIACVLIVGGVIIKAIIDRRNGKTCCGDCSCCGQCRKDKDKKDNSDDKNKK